MTELKGLTSTALVGCTGLLVGAYSRRTEIGLLTMKCQGSQILISSSPEQRSMPFHAENLPRIPLTSPTLSTKNPSSGLPS